VETIGGSSECSFLGSDLTDKFEQHPSHGWNSWKTRYRNKFTYISPGNVEESEISTSEASPGFRLPTQRNPKKGFLVNGADPALFHSSAAGVQRSTRIRKPAQRDQIY
jgi:hypothetical protein